ncbi:MAG: TetR/AcrR family transcriptional regulator, partial [Desulfovibrio sp.]|nr:TetR/AcrR family transcriptional regulator [Desulfovibrio sp.]
MTRKSSKKDALLQAAKELFGEYGYAETTFKKISDRA